MTDAAAPGDRPPAAAPALRWARPRYGAWAVPLAFAALPLYVHWPAHMAARPGWDLATLGLLLLAVRALDAAADPWLGRWIDQIGRGQGGRLLALGLAGAALLGGGWSALFLLPWPAGATGWTLAAAALLLTSLGYSLAQIAHQAWGVALAAAEPAGPDADRPSGRRADRPADLQRGRSADAAAPGAQARWVGAREAGALLGVIVASVLPALAGWPATVALWWALAVAGAWALAPLCRRPTAVRAAAGAPSRAGPAASRSAAVADRRRWKGPLLVQLASGLAAAVPATLVLLVVRDVLGGGAPLQALALLAYFGAAAAAVPLAARLVVRWGTRRAWAAGMAAAALAFLPFGLAPSVPLFLAVCVLTGAALALETLAGQSHWIAVLDAEGAQRHAQGFGWWALVNKATLALAAGLALPLVHALGYRAAADGAAAAGSGVLLAVYVGLPVLFKTIAAALLWAPAGVRRQRAAAGPHTQETAP